MSNTEVYKLIDLIEDIKKVDGIIAVHSNKEDADIMLSQYQAKKVRLMSSLVSELISPSFSSTSSLLFIKQLLQKFFADTPHLSHTDKQIKEIKLLESVL